MSKTTIMLFFVLTACGAAENKQPIEIKLHDCDSMLTMAQVDLVLNSLQEVYDKPLECVENKPIEVYCNNSDNGNIWGEYFPYSYHVVLYSQPESDAPYTFIHELVHHIQNMASDRLTHTMPYFSVPTIYLIGGNSITDRAIATYKERNSHG